MSNKTDIMITNTILSSLSDLRRRIIVRLLSDRASPVGLQELATNLVAEEQDKPLVAVEQSEREAVAVDLVQIQLPTLDDAGLITWSHADETATTTTHPAFQDPKFEQMLHTQTDGWDTVLAALAHKRRRVVLSILTEHTTSMARADLARQVVAYETDTDTETPAAETVLESLHHVHLPKIEQAGLIEYNMTSGIVTYKGHPALDEEWLVASATDTPRAILSMAEQSADIWTLNGRDDVTERGRALCEAANEELFMMFTVDDAVETACLRRIQDALDRGVDVYMGTQNTELRDLIRENAPEVTIWEPQLDWLNLPPKREKVGRLILADREEILIGTVGETAPDGVPCETAITGAGEDNPLVMLLREMLGSRLDHLDAQSEDFRSEIPL